MSKYEMFDRSRLEIKGLGERVNDLEIWELAAAGGLYT